MARCEKKVAAMVRRAQHWSIFRRAHLKGLFWRKTQRDFSGGLFFVWRPFFFWGPFFDEGSKGLFLGAFLVCGSSKRNSVQSLKAFFFS